MLRPFVLCFFSSGVTDDRHTHTHTHTHTHKHTQRLQQTKIYDISFHVCLRMASVNVSK